MAKYNKDPHPTKGNTLPPVTPVQVDRVRRSVLDVVRKNIPEVREVLAGNKKWDSQQTRLFSLMLNKVMPDLHHSFNEHTIETKNVDELTIDELHAIAAQAAQTDPQEDIEGEAYEHGTDTATSRTEAPETSEGEG